MRRGPVTLQSPVNWQHPLARGLRAFWLPQAGWANGMTLRDLCRRHDGEMVNFATTRWRSWNGERSVFADGSDDRIDSPRPAVTTYPCSLFADVFVPSSLGNFLNGWCVGGSVRAAGGGRIGLVIHNPATAGNRAVRVTTASTDASVEYLINVRDVRLRCLATLPGTGTNASTLYVNGAPVATGTAASPASGPNYTSLCARQTGASSWSAFFGGHILSAAIWNRALSEKEAVALYQEARAGYPGLLNRVRRVLDSTPVDVAPQPQHPLFFGQAF